MCLFVAHLAEAGLRPASVKSYLAAVRHLQISVGLPALSVMATFPRLTYILKGLKRSHTSSPTKQRFPITPTFYHC